MRGVVGIDTWSVAWYVREGSPPYLAMSELATKPAGRGRLLPDTVCDHRVGWFKDAGMIYAEGHPSVDGLAAPDPDALNALVEDLAEELTDYGVTVPQNESPFDRSGSPGFAGVRRLDLTTDVQRPAKIGSAILTGIAALEPHGRLQSVTFRQPGGRAVETVAWRGRKGTVARVYDKGVESGSHDRGERVRFEDQRRWPAGSRRTIDELTPDAVCETFRRRFKPIWRSAKGVKVVTLENATAAIKAAERNGVITPGEAIDAAGYLLLEANGYRVGHRQTQWRHRNIVRKLGLVVQDDGVLEEVEIDLGDELEFAMDVR